MVKGLNLFQQKQIVLTNSKINGVEVMSYILIIPQHDLQVNEVIL